MTIATEFLRSINLTSDLEQPSRFAHFQPTTKSLQVVEAVAGGRANAATIVVAAYGSGKSLASGVGALLAQNSPEARHILAPIVTRIASLYAATATGFEKRLESSGRGLVVPLHGYVPKLSRGICHAAQLSGDHQDLKAALRALRQKARRKNLDRIAIVWDEFGRHLESLVGDGRATDLVLVQELAEWVARQTKPRTTLTVLLHQSLLNYASYLNQSARHAWRKIEGRFETLRFVDDSRELYELIARVVARARPNDAPCRPATVFGAVAAKALDLGWFAGFPEVEGLQRLLLDAQPLTSGALYALPFLAARIAQNERSIFTFLNQADLTAPVGIEQMYGYFAEAMRSDTGLGGTYRRWLETESARSRALDDLERELLAATCLLQLGAGGERRRLPRAALALAVIAGSDHDLPAIDPAIDRLLERKLLLHRRRNDDISIWHGADIDLRARVAEEAARLQREIDLTAFLTKESPPPFERPLRHNVERSVPRFWAGRYLPAAELLALGSEHPAFALQPGEDGRLLYVFAETADALEAARDLAQTVMPDDPGLVLVIPKRPLALTDAALELAALLRLRDDQHLVGADPLVLPELKELTAVARDHLHRVLEHIHHPAPQAADCFVQCLPFPVGDDSPLSELLSELADTRFPNTPRIVNEQVVRHRVTRPTVNARKKVILGILERSGMPDLGFSGMTTPDASICRTVLQRTGLYREGPSGWSWTDPRELPDPALAEVWSTLQAFFATPQSAPKPAAELLDRLLAPPYGIRRGVLPLLFAAGMRAFGHAVAVRREGIYLADILATEIEAICAEPERFTVQVLALDAATKSYLEGVVLDFSGEPAPPAVDLVRAAFDAIVEWKAQLPEAALATHHLGSRVQQFQRILKSCHDPVEFLFHRVPAIFAIRAIGPELLDALVAARRRLDGVVEGYTAEAIEIIRSTLSFGTNHDGTTVLMRARAWADCFADAAVPSDALSLSSRALLARAYDATNGRYTEAAFARALSAALLGRGFEKWDDHTGKQFADQLRAHVDEIERATFELGRPTPTLAPVLEGRLVHLVGQLRAAVGVERADRVLDLLKTKEADA